MARRALRILAGAPHALSLLRVLLAFAYVASLSGVGSIGDVSRKSSLSPLVIAAIASATDFIDGRLARRLGSASPLGAAVDVAADAVFVLLALGALASCGQIPWVHPIAAAVALAALALAWSTRAVDPALPSAPARSIADRVGHGAGIANFAIIVAASVVVAGLVAAPWLWTASVLVSLLNLIPLVLRATRR